MLQVSLFGTFSIRSNELVFERSENTKALELLCYLLVHRDQPHPREKIGALLWENSSTAQSKKNLRQTLWQLQAILAACCQPHSDNLLLIEPEWLQFNKQADIALDVREFEQAYIAIQETPGSELSASQVHLTEKALELYQGSLLDGWYQDWCLFERERLQDMYLMMLNKMIGFCEIHQHFEQGINYGMQILRHDRAHERTHMHLMRLYCLAGDRTAALRQYQRCVTALREELNVEPSRQTLELYNLIIHDQLEPLSTSSPSKGAEIRLEVLRDALGQMYQFGGFLETLHHRLQAQIHTVEHILGRLDQ